MSDIVERLRDDQPGERQAKREARMELGGLLMEAADEIEKLRAERDALATQLTQRSSYEEGLEEGIKIGKAADEIERLIDAIEAAQECIDADDVVGAYDVLTKAVNGENLDD